MTAAIAALFCVPVCAAPALDALQLEARLRQGVVQCFREPERLLDIVPLHMPPDEDAKTCRAMPVLFGHVKIEELVIGGVTAAGHVDRLRVKVSNIDLFGFRIDTVTVALDDFTVDLARLLDKDELGIISDARAKMSVRVLEADLNRVSPQYRMDLRHDDFAVSGRAGVMFIRAGYRLHGNLVVTPENQVVFHPKSLSYGILPIPKALYAAQVRRINPIFDMARFLGTTRGGFDLHFDRVAIEQEEAGVELSGIVHAHPIKVEALPPPPSRS